MIRACKNICTSSTVKLDCDDNSQLHEGKPRPETLLIPVFLPTNNGIFRDLF